MAISPARVAASEILLRVEREQAYASDLLHSARYEDLSPRDHGLATELVMGCLRWQSRLDRWIADASTQKLDRLDDEVLIALRLGAYQLRLLSKVPAHAAIFESVELVKKARKRSAASFVNAVLRKAGKAGAADSSPDIFAAIRQSSDPTVLAEKSSHPRWLVDRWAARYRFERARQICGADQTVPVTSIRIPDERAANALAEAGVKLLPGQLLATSRRLNSGTSASIAKLAADGVAIQDEASQLVALALGGGKNILDCCAAPGGKTALLARSNPTGRVFATELHPHRARLLHKLISLPNVFVVASDARQLPFACEFDRILADVPCSGTGTLARNPEIKWRLTPEDLNDLQGRQIDIIKSALRLLVPGGKLIYSTCSLEPEENESVIEAALAGSHRSALKVIPFRDELERMQRSGELLWRDLQCLLAGPYLRTLPGVHPCEGFFAAMIERE